MDNKFKINQSVAIKGVNNPKDVKEIQLLLQQNGYCNIGIDGKVGLPFIYKRNKKIFPK